MTAATATLRLSDGPGIGIDTVSSASSRQSAETPWRSLPTTRASGRRRSVSQTARSLSGVATTTVMPRTRSHARGRPRSASAIRTWNSVPTEAAYGVRMEDVRAHVARHERGRAGRARGADDRAEVARALDSLRDEDQRAGRVGERRERRRPTLDDGDRAVRAAPRWRSSGTRSRNLEHPGATALGERD